MPSSQARSKSSAVGNVSVDRRAQSPRPENARLREHCLAAPSSPQKHPVKSEPRRVTLVHSARYVHRVIVTQRVRKPMLRDNAHLASAPLVTALMFCSNANDHTTAESDGVPFFL